MLMASGDDDACSYALSPLAQTHQQNRLELTIGARGKMLLLFGRYAPEKLPISLVILPISLEQPPSSIQSPAHQPTDFVVCMLHEVLDAAAYLGFGANVRGSRSRGLRGAVSQLRQACVATLPVEEDDDVEGADERQLEPLARNAHVVVALARVLRKEQEGNAARRAA
eukprot:610066-Pleurochrysis_carterae.AAC.6